VQKDMSRGNRRQ